MGCVLLSRRRKSKKSNGEADEENEINLQEQMALDHANSKTDSTTIKSIIQGNVPLQAFLSSVTSKIGDFFILEGVKRGTPIGKTFKTNQ